MAVNQSELTALHTVVRRNNLSEVVQALGIVAKSRAQREDTLGNAIQATRWRGASQRLYAVTIYTEGL